jgi:hypothetical protein
VVKKRKIFFAYESGHADNRDAIRKGALEYNRHQHTYHVQTWEDLRVGGAVINATIFEAIDECEIFACDMTYQNHNVLFELGYAIARQKKLLIFLNESIVGSKQQYADFKMLRGIGYDSFSSSRQINSALQKKVHVNTVLLDQLVNVQRLERDTGDVFFINSKVENQASIELSDYLKSDGLSVVTNYTSEVEYQTFIWYVTNLFKAKKIILHMIASDKVDSKKLNAESSLFAGLALGLGKKVLLVAPAPFNAPIDYSDILVEYSDAEDCLAKVSSWVERKPTTDPKLVSIDTPENAVGQDEGKKLNLLRLGIGYEIAEEEESALLNYYIENESYHKALSRTSGIVVGRKGTGKSALFIKLISDFENSKDVFTVVIKPDSDELLDNIEFTKIYDNERSKKTFLLTVWRFVIFSKLLRSCVRAIETSGRIDRSATEQRALDFQSLNEAQLSLNFYGVIQYINSTITVLNPPPQTEILTTINNSFIHPLVRVVQEYLGKTKYKKIHILADNLDKSWDSKNDLSLQSEMILSLLEFAGKMKTEVDNQDIEVNTMILLRKDIYDFILRSSREPDKITVKTIFIDWAKYPNKLKALLEERFRYTLGLNPEFRIESIWRDYFSIGSRGNAFEEILKVVVPRPRDVIYFVSRLFEFAVNKDLMVVNQECYRYAIDEYSNFLHNNLIAEVKAEFPEIERIMSQIQTSLFGQRVEFQKFHDILMKITNDESRNVAILESLFNKQYMIGMSKRGPSIFTDYEEMAKKVDERFLFFFRRHKIYILLHPRRYTRSTLL